MPFRPTLALLAGRWRAHSRTARLLAVAALLALAGVAGWSLLELIPHRYALTISGTDITSNRHLFAKALQETALDNDVALTLRPTSGSQEALAQVAAGKLDLAFVQGGMDLYSPNVVQVATLNAEALHFLVRPGIEDFAGLRGHRVNMNSHKGGTRLVARQILAFAGLRDELDYVESNIPAEELLTRRGDLPDAIVVTAFAPSDVVDYLVRQQGYRLLEVPFAAAFAQRHPWATEVEIGAFLYGVAAPVPPRPFKTVGVKLSLVAHRGVPTRAVVDVLETLYGSALEARLRMHLDEGVAMSAGAYPPAEGTRRYLDRNKPLFSRELFDKLKAAIGLVASVYSTLLVLVKWFRQVPASLGLPDGGAAGTGGAADGAAAAVTPPSQALDLGAALDAQLISKGSLP